MLQLTIEQLELIQKIVNARLTKEELNEIKIKAEQIIDRRNSNSK